MELIQEFVDAGRSPEEYSVALAERANAACRDVHGKQRTLQGFGAELRRLVDDELASGGAPFGAAPGPAGAPLPSAAASGSAVGQTQNPLPRSAAAGPKKGARVEVLFQDGIWYGGLVLAAQWPDYQIRYDDGDLLRGQLTLPWRLAAAKAPR